MRCWRWLFGNKEPISTPGPACTQTSQSGQRRVFAGTHATPRPSLRRLPQHFQPRYSALQREERAWCRVSRVSSPLGVFILGDSILFCTKSCCIVTTCLVSFRPGASRQCSALHLLNSPSIFIKTYVVVLGHDIFAASFSGKVVPGQGTTWWPP